LILKTGLTDDEAKRHEIYMIFVLGRKNIGTGRLINLTSGGESKSGWVCPEEYKQKWQGENNPMFGRKGELNPNARLTDAQRAEIKEMYIPRGKGNGYGNGSALAEKYGVAFCTIRRIAISEEP
jgi:hypothetical protein